jgi:hypothetical protein
MKGGMSSLFVTLPAEMVVWFKEKYICCTELPKLLAASWRARVLRESTQVFIIKLAEKGKRKICRIKTGTRITYSIVTCGTHDPPSCLNVQS